MAQPSLLKFHPYYFKFIGLALAILSLAVGIYLKVSHAASILNFSPKWTQVTFLFSTLLMITSKDKTEDERTDYLRLRTVFSSSVVLIYFIIFNEIQALRNDASQGMNLFELAIGLTVLQAISFELLKNSDWVEWTEKNKFMYSLAAVTGMGMLVYFSRWIWGI